MAKFVVAGRANCPYYARAELLGDRLAKNLDMFHFHKIMIQPDEWEQWLKSTCTEKGWDHSKSPIIWRELIDRGGKGVLIGGANEFQEYVKAYYDLESEMNSYDMRTVAQENKVTKDELDEEDRVYKALSKPVHICITQASSPVTYHLLNSISSGNVLGSNVEVTIRLLVSSPSHVESVKGMAMEVEDLAHHLMREIKVCTDPHEAFQNCSIVILLDDLVQQKDEKKIDWLKRNEDFFSGYAKIINSVALSSCKVLLCGSGSPINFNAMTMIREAPKLSRQNIVALSTLLENNAKSVIGERLVVNPAGIVDLLVWGNINGVNYYDVKKCRVHNYDGAIWGPYWYSVDAMEMIHDNKWILQEFPELVHARNQKVSEAMMHSTCLSSGNAICTTLSYWCQGSPKGQLLSMAVYSEGWYGVPEGLVFSFPVTMDPKGYWHVAQDIDLTHELKQAIREAVEDLKRELAIFRGEIEDEDITTEEEKKPDEAVELEAAKPDENTDSATVAIVTDHVPEGEADTKGETSESAEKPDSGTTVHVDQEPNAEGQAGETEADAVGEETSEEKPSAEGDASEEVAESQPAE